METGLYYPGLFKHYQSFTGHPQFVFIDFFIVLADERGPPVKPRRLLRGFGEWTGNSIYGLHLPDYICL